MLHIGSYTILNNLLLAPMAGVTDSIFRSLCVEYGAGYTVSEMVSSDTTLHNSHKTLNRIRRDNSGMPHVVQIVGSNPDALAEAARYNVRQGADIIDINMGCPAKKVCNKLAGSALLADEALVERILVRVVGAVKVPVTLKIRTGSDPEHRNGVAIARIAERCGIQALAVHGRTRADRFLGHAEYDTIRAIKQSVSIPVIANGDIATPEQARRVLTLTGADGLMIGRAAQGYPFLFREVRATLDQRSAPGPVDARELHGTLTRHIRELHQLYGDSRGVRIARKHIAWYVRQLQDAAAFRNRINQIDSASEQLRQIDLFFERLPENVLRVAA